MTWRTGAGPGGLTRKRPGHNINTYNTQLTQNRKFCPCRSPRDDDGVRRHPDKTCNTEIQEMCPAPGVRANWERVAYPAGFKLEALIGQ